MPTKVIRYTCDYRCGKDLGTKNQMVRHEKGCWNNQAVKACNTCVFNEDVENKAAFGANFKHRMCNHEEGKFILAAQYEKLRDGFNIRPVTNCPHYEPLETVTNE